MKAGRISRRGFLGGCLAAALLPVRLPAARQDVGARRVFDAVSGEPLVGALITAKRVGRRGRWRFETDAEGLYPFNRIAADLERPGKVRLRISPGSGGHIPYEFYLHVLPDAESNANIGDVGLVPLERPGSAAGIDDEAFNSNWAELLKQIFFAVDRQPSPRPRKTLPGSLARFDCRDVLVRVAGSLSSAENGFVRDVLPGAVRDLSGGLLRVRKFRRVSAESALVPAAELPAGTITVARRDDFPRPAVRIRYGNTAPAAEGAECEEVNPHEILAAQIILDVLTLDELYKNGTGNDDERRYARSLVQRCVAYALGWRPTMLLPGRTVVDDNYGPPGAYTRRLLTAEDRALALAAYGGGSGCYPPGVRFAKGPKPKLRADKKYPLVGEASP